MSFARKKFEKLAHYPELYMSWQKIYLSDLKTIVFSLDENIVYTYSIYLYRAELS